MSNVIPFSGGTVSSVFAGQGVNNDLAAGVSAGFGLIGYKGKVWSIRHRGTVIPLLRDDGDGPRNSIEVVILQSSTVISKIWYDGQYVEGSTEAPDCYSLNGVAPEPTSRKLQSPVCATCPRNAWGSRVTPAGKQGKECSDSKRLAVVPLGDLKNEAFGGPLLLRVPAASLQGLAQFGDKMHKLGFPYYAIGTRIAFDAQEAYPKFIFTAIRPLNDEEAMQVVEWRADPLVQRIIAEAEHAAPAQQQPQQSAFEQTQGGVSSVFQKTQQPAPAASAAVQVQPPPPPAQPKVQSTGFGPIPGTASTTPAQAAGATTTSASTGNGRGPDTQPTPTASSDGSATGASSSHSSAGNVQTGFGPIPRVNPETITPASASTEKSAVSNTTATDDIPAAPQDDNFTASLDNKLKALLPG